MKIDVTRSEYLEANRGPGGTRFVELVSDADGKVHNIELKLAGTYHRFAVGTCKKGDEGRQECGADKVAGPWAYAFGLGSMITATRCARTPEVEIDDGDVIFLDGIHYLVTVDRREWLKLDILHEDGSTSPNMAGR